MASGAGSRGVAQRIGRGRMAIPITILNIPGMFILQAKQGTTAFDLNKFAWVGAMGEGEKYFISVGQNSPLKTYDDLKRLSAQRPVKLSVTGPEGTAYMAAVVGSQLMGLRTQLITGYRGSADYVVAAVRGDSDAVVAALPTTMRFRRGQLRPLASFETKSSIPGIQDATRSQAGARLIRVERWLQRLRARRRGRDILSAALAKALIDPAVVNGRRRTTSS